MAQGDSYIRGSDLTAPSLTESIDINSAPYAQQYRELQAIRDHEADMAALRIGIVILFIVAAVAFALWRRRKSVAASLDNAVVGSLASVVRTKRKAAAAGSRLARRVSERADA